MGLLDDAIREHLDLMRRHGANEAEVARQEAEALGPVLREEGEAEEGGSAAPATAEAEPSLPYDRAAEAGLTGDPDLPSFEWHGSSTAEPDVPSFVSPEAPRGTEPEPDGGESRADAEQVGPGPTEAFDAVEDDPAVEEPEVSVEPDVPEAEGTLQEDRSAELSPEPPAEPALPEEHPIERPVPTEADDRPAEVPPLEDETGGGPAPTEDDLPASFEPDPFESVPGLGTEASEEPAVPPPDHEPPEEGATAFHPAVVDTPEPALADVEDLPPEPEPVPPEGGPLPLDAEESSREHEPPPLTAGEVVEELPVDLGPGEPPLEERLEPAIEEPFVAGEEEAWREAGEAPGDVSGSLPEPPLGGAASSEDLDPQPVEADPLFEPADEPPLDERPLRGPAPDAELPPSEPLDASFDEPLDTPDEPPHPLPPDPEAARGFFDETAEHERPAREERSPTVDPDFED